MDNESIKRGSYRDCLAHYFDHITRLYPKGSPELIQARTVIGNFMGVEAKAVYRWMTKKSAPIGSMPFRLYVFLTASGYEITEFERMEPAKQLLVKLIAYKIISPGETMKLFGFRDETDLFVFLRERQVGKGSIPEKLARIYEFWKQNREELEKRQKEANVSLPPASLPTRSSPLSPVTPVVTPAVNKPPTVKAAPPVQPELEKAPAEPSFPKGKEGMKELSVEDNLLNLGVKMLIQVSNRLLENKTARDMLPQVTRDLLLQLSMNLKVLLQKLYEVDRE